MIKQYKVLKPIVLGFLTPQDQFDILVKKDDLIEANEHTIWFIDGNKKHESITMANAIQIWLDKKAIIGL